MRWECSRKNSKQTNDEKHMTDPLSDNPTPPPYPPKADETRTTHRHSGPGHQEVRHLAIDAARLLRDLHCEEVLLFDVRGLSDLTDYVLIATGTSDRQIRSVGQDVERLAKQRGLPRYGCDEDEGTTWLVLDLVDLMVHLFESVTRAHYDLEMMWGDAPRVDWRHEATGE